MTVLVSPPPASNALAGHEPIDQLAWDDLGKTGIVYDFTGDAWRVTATGTNTSVTVGAVGDIAEVRGFRCRQSAGEVLTFGTGIPGTGQSRYILVVLRLNRSNATASVTARYSTSVTGTPNPPAPIQDSSSWDLPLALIRQYGPAGIMSQPNITDVREWTGEHQFVADSGSLNGPVGCTRTRAGLLWERRMVNGAPSWVNAMAATVENRPEVIIEDIRRTTTSAGQIVWQRAYGRVPRHFSITPYALADTVARNIGVISVASKNANGFTLRVQRRDSQAELDNNPVNLTVAVYF